MIHPILFMVNVATMMLMVSILRTSLDNPKEQKLVIAAFCLLYVVSVLGGWTLWVMIK